MGKEGKEGLVLMAMIEVELAHPPRRSCNSKARELETSVRWFTKLSCCFSLL